VIRQRRTPLPAGHAPFYLDGSVIEAAVIAFA
jgi:hypothetical protein